MNDHGEVEELRRRIDEVDAAIVEAVNTRLALVQELWQVKARIGVDRVDPGRERRLREALAAVNRGPLTPEGLDELIGSLLALVKRELGRAGGGAP